LQVTVESAESLSTDILVKEEILEEPIAAALDTLIEESPSTARRSSRQPGKILFYSQAFLFHKSFSHQIHIFCKCMI